MSLKNNLQLKKEMHEQTKKMKDLSDRFLKLNDVFATKKDMQDIRQILSVKNEQYITKEECKKEMHVLKEHQEHSIREMNKQIQSINNQYRQIISLKKEIEEAMNKIIHAIQDTDKELELFKKFKDSIVLKKEFEKEIDLLKERCATESQVRSVKSELNQSLFQTNKAVLPKKEAEEKFAKLEGLIKQQRENIVKIEENLKKVQRQTTSERKWNFFRK